MNLPTELKKLIFSFNGNWKYLASTNSILSLQKLNNKTILSVQHFKKICEIEEENIALFKRIRSPSWIMHLMAGMNMAGNYSN